MRFDCSSLIEYFSSTVDRRGELTALGREEHRALGYRLYHRFPTLFEHRPVVHVMTSGKKRAVDSAEEFIYGLLQSTDPMEIRQEKPNKKLLYFHRSCPNYLAFKHNNTQVRMKLETIKKLDQTRVYARQVLRRIFKDDFVELLIQGRYLNEPSENHPPLDPFNPKNEVDLVICLYAMFSIAPAHHPSSLSKLLVKYFNRDESYWFAYFNDAQVDDQSMDELIDRSVSSLGILYQRSFDRWSVCHF